MDTAWIDIHVHVQCMCYVHVSIGASFGKSIASTYCLVHILY